MLKGDLYNLEVLSREGQACSAELSLIPGSRIYAAHFPGMPITPGVCILQMCVEVASEAAGRHLELSEAKDIRFLVPLKPESDTRVRIDFSLPEGEDLPIGFVVSLGETTHAKLKLILQ